MPALRDLRAGVSAAELPREDLRGGVLPRVQSSVQGRAGVAREKAKMGAQTPADISVVRGVWAGISTTKFVA
jgi:hypothetical protein